MGRTVDPVGLPSVARGAVAAAQGAQRHRLTAIGRLRSTAGEAGEARRVIGARKGCVAIVADKADM